MTRVNNGGFGLAVCVAFFIHSIAMVALPFIVGPTTAQLPLPVTVTLSAAMAPPPPPPPPPANPTPKKRIETFDASRLASREVMTDEQELIESNEAVPMVGVPDGVVGGVPGGALGGVIGEIVANNNPIAPPPPPAPKPAPVPERIQVRSDLQKGKLLVSPAPDYPVLAVKARITGTVSLRTVIGRTGAVEELKVLSGHPLLVKAAVFAVKRWRYKPTLISGKPVEVITQVDVHFRLVQK